MAEPTHTQLRLSLGSYLLGSLDPAERATLEGHLLGCTSCRTELVCFRSLPALMSTVSIDQVRQGPLRLPPGVLSRALDAVAAEHAVAPTHLRRWRVATVVSAAAAVVVAAVLGVMIVTARTAAVAPAPSPSTADGVPLVAAAGVTATGTGTLVAKPWGTAVTLQLRGLPQGESFTAWVTAADGTRAVAATWTPTPSGNAMLTGAAGTHDATHAGLQVMQGNIILLTLPAHL